MDRSQYEDLDRDQLIDHIEQLEDLVELLSRHCEPYTADLYDALVKAMSGPINGSV